MTLSELIATIKDTANGHSFLVIDKWERVKS